MSDERYIENYKSNSDNRNVHRFPKSFLFFSSHISLQSGQTLIETLGALGIIGIVISAIGVVVTASLRNATFNEDQTLATKYAQQGSEIVQQIRHDDYNAFAALSGTYCLGKGQTTLGA